MMFLDAPGSKLFKKVKRKIGLASKDTFEVSVALNILKDQVKQEKAIGFSGGELIFEEKITNQKSGANYWEARVLECDVLVNKENELTINLRGGNVKNIVKERLLKLIEKHINEVVKYFDDTENEVEK